MKKYKYDVTILVASYNPEWYALKRTLCSVLNQKKVSYQIVIADDGSKTNFHNEVIDLFDKYKFNDYEFLASETNNGTCINIYNGLLKSDGEYVKTIGPGDCLYEKTTLLDWVNFAKQKDADICFGDAIFFSKNENKTEEIISKRRYPQNVTPYLKENYSIKEGIYNYVLLGDVVWGSNLLTKTEIMLIYLQRIIGKIIYAEDMIYRMMIADGKKISYYRKNVIWYEYGSGISTSNDCKWNDIISNERIISNNMIAKSNVYYGLDKIKFGYVLNCLSNKKTNWIKYIIYPMLIIYKIRKDMININTDDSIEIQGLFEICEEGWKNQNNASD